MLRAAILDGTLSDYATEVETINNMRNNFPCSHTKSALERTGHFLSREIPEEVKDEAARHFRIAYEWRLAHMLPMTRIRMSVAHTAHKISRSVLSAARLKRMLSIRRKLREKMSLPRIQDIGGCRIVFETMNQVDELVRKLQTESRHKVVQERDYIRDPKIGGYRSQHLVLNFHGTQDEAAFNRHKIEVQIRTRLQHSWATAVEAVGMVTQQPLKAGKGDERWLRFFALMAGEIAAIERQAAVPNVAEDAKIRRSELRALDAELDAIKNLESYNDIISTVDVNFKGKAKLFMVRYDYDEKKVTIRPLHVSADFANTYRKAEGGTNVDSVLVEADGIEDLRSAFPNYFLDVKLFTDLLKARIKGNQMPTIARRFIKQPIIGP